MPDHCSQMIGCAGLWAKSFKSVFVKVASSAATSVQVLPLPKTMDFSFSSTPAFAKTAQPVLHVLNGLVVDVENAMDGRVRDAIEHQKEQSRLCLQRSGSGTSSINEDCR